MHVGACVCVAHLHAFIRVDGEIWQGTCMCTSACDAMLVHDTDAVYAMSACDVYVSRDVSSVSPVAHRGGMVVALHRLQAAEEGVETDQTSARTVRTKGGGRDVVAHGHVCAWT